MQKFLKFSSLACLVLSLSCRTVVDGASNKSSEVVPKKIRSGLQVNDKALPFYVRDVTGPLAGKDLCYRSRYRDRPTVAVFFNKATQETQELLSAVDQFVGQNAAKGMAGYAIYTTNFAPEHPDDVLQASQELRRIAKSKNIVHIPLTAFDGVPGPKEYMLSPNATLSIAFWANGLSVFSYGFSAPSLSASQIQSVIEDLNTALQTGKCDSGVYNSGEFSRQKQFYDCKSKCSFDEDRCITPDPRHPGPPYPTDAERRHCDEMKRLCNEKCCDGFREYCTH